MEIKPRGRWDIFGSIGMIIIFLGGFYIYSKITRTSNNEDNKPQIIEKTIVLKPPVCDLKFDEYDKLARSQSVKLVDNLNSYGINGNFYNSRSINVLRSGNGEIACGYLYVRAKIDGKPLDDKYDSIYINPQGLGGHILRSTGLVNVKDNKTEVLMPLNSVAYLPNAPYDPNSTESKITNWVKLIDAAQIINFYIALSTTDKRGVIEEIRVAYKCWNPDTGIENSECRLGAP